MFHSYLFVFVLLPLLVAGYYGFAGRKKTRAALLFLNLISLLFYLTLGVRALLIFTLSALSAYAASAVMETRVCAGHAGRCRFFACCGIGIQLLLLLLFKIPPDFRALLPVGLGFYTLRQSAFLLDRIKGEAPHYGLLEYMTWMLYLPSLTQGPITLHEEMIPQFQSVSERPFRAEPFARGIVQFILGLAKKMLLADMIGLLVNACYDNYERLESVSALLTVCLYLVQLYFDFSAYCDMAEGISSMLQIRLPANFDSPLLAASPRAFWRRWHMTLSRFFTRYVYIPLGGSRKGRLRKAFATLLVFVLSGLWHGAGWGYLLWGIWEGIPVCIDSLRKKKEAKERSGEGRLLPFKRLCTFLYVSAGFVFFRAPDLDCALTVFQRLFSFVPLSNAFCRVLPSYLAVPENYVLAKALSLKAPEAEPYVYLFSCLLLLLVAGMVLCRKNARRIAQEMPGKGFLSLKFTCAMALLFVWSVLSFSGVSTFLYFQY